MENRVIMEIISNSRQVKSTRFEMDQVKIEALEKENQKLRKTLQKTEQKKEDLYRISIEYQKLCEEEIQKSQLLIKEIEKLNQKLQEYEQFPQKPTKSRFFPQKSAQQVQNYNKVLTSCISKVEKHRLLGPEFKEKVMNESLEFSELDKVVIRLLKFIEDCVPMVGNTVHRKNASYDVRASNPLFKEIPQIIIKRPPNSKSNVEKPENLISSKELERHFETLESCVSTRSNYSSNIVNGKPKVRVFRREKSVSQLV